MPSEDMYGVKNMNADTYNKKFKPWYDEVKSDPNWDIEHEMTIYCRADVELLSMESFFMTFATSWARGLPAQFPQSGATPNRCN